MKIYLAGNLDDERNPTQREHALIKRGVARPGAMDPVRRLVSFAYPQFTPAALAYKSEFGTAVEYAIDSGAFSGWSLGLPIDLDKYAGHILAHHDLYGSFVASLDVIPGSKKTGGVKNATATERERAAEEGWENWVELKRLLKPAGITPIHTYHLGEDIRWLRRLIDESEYLGLGGGATTPTREKIRWLDSIMLYLTDYRGWPIRKMHGFACTAGEVMARYPWESVDSASWLHASEHGDVYIRLPDGADTIVNFHYERWKPAPPSRHFTHYGEADRKVIAEYLAAREFTPEQLSDVYCDNCGAPHSALNRDAVNAAFFWDIEEEKTRNPRPWHRPVGVLRLGPPRPPAGGFNFA